MTSDGDILGAGSFRGHLLLARFQGGSHTVGQDPPEVSFVPVFVDPLNSQGNDPFNLNVRYSGANPIDVSTLDDTDILITGPNGYSKMGTFFSAPPNGAGDDTTPSDVDLSGGELGSFEVSLEVVGVQRRVENTWFAKPQATAGAFEAIRARVSSRRLEVWDQGEMSR